MDVGSFSSGQDALSKSPAPAHGLAGHDARQAPSGVAFSFLLATQEKSDSSAVGDRKLLLLLSLDQRASRLKSLPQTLKERELFDARPKEVPCGQAAPLRRVARP